jgi:hypothetical protein
MADETESFQLAWHGNAPQETAMPAYNNIHRQQLFHWIGGHIDILSGDNKLNDGLREGYVACLRGALKNGLWVKKPRDPDFLGRGDLIKITRPICCFTEWNLLQSRPHTSRYGRLGLGFPKRFVLNHGGQPVTYVRDSLKNDPYSSALKKLAGFFRDGTDCIKLPARRVEALKQHFDYLAHFSKRIKRPAAPRVAFRRVSKAARPVPSISKLPDPFNRRFGTTLHYLEEREWRIVYSPALDEFFETGDPRGMPKYYLPFVPGRELFTVVLPDNHTVNMALNDKFIRQKLYPADAPHVTILSLQDIGTF